MNRSAAILLHISSLASPYGIGTMGVEAIQFVDFLAFTNVKYWQLLPLSPLGYGNSPYQSESVFAGNYMLIDLTMLVQEGLLQTEQITALTWGSSSEKADFEQVATNKEALLRVAYQNASASMKMHAKLFTKHNQWAEEYCLYKAIKTNQDNLPFYEWKKDWKRFDKCKLYSQLSPRDSAEFDYHSFVQYLFFTQYARLRSYANDRGIGLIGDLPIYPSADSADVWAHSEGFLLDEDLQPTHVAGVPPDAFSEDGQRWGNPLYDWKVMEQDGFGWWSDRMAQSLNLFDLVRIDHFRGFDGYWSIPADHLTAKMGQWQEGPKMKLFDAMEKRMGRLPIIVEDLGILNDSVRAFLKESGYPGMKVLQFAFYPDVESAYLPHKTIPNCVLYTGTHDNDTLVGWLSSQSEDAKAYIEEYMNVKNPVARDVIKMAWASVADLAVTTMQDILEIDNTGRMNLPGTVSDANWGWRMPPHCLTYDLALEIQKLNRVFYR